LRSDGRNCRITASRARSSDIGSERENSRIGTRRTAEAPAGSEPECFGDFFRAIVNHASKMFALQQTSTGLIRTI
jgi:hypothetical protein